MYNTELYLCKSHTPDSPGSTFLLLAGGSLMQWSHLLHGEVWNREGQYTLQNLDWSHDQLIELEY